ncbi:MAG: glycosyltransferase family 4 protein [Rhodospirillaceae bacterium]
MSASRPPHFLLFNYEYPPVGGGGGNATQQIGRTLIKRGAKVTVLTAAQGQLPRRENDNGVQVYRIWAARRHQDRCSVPEMLVFLAHALLTAPGLARQNKADAALIFFGMPTGPVGWWLKKHMGLPYVVSLQGGDVPGFMGDEMATYHRVAGPVITEVWRRAFAVVANSTGLAALAQRHAPDVEVEMIPAGADLNAITPSPMPTLEGPLRLLFVGRLVHQKGLDVLLKSLGTLKEDDWTLTIAGEGPLKEELEFTSQTLGLADRITFRGWLGRTQLPEVYKQADVFVLPSRDEGMPNAMLEAMSAGLPIVGSKVAGLDEVVIDGDCGLLVPPENAKALSDALHALISDRDKAFTLGQAARKRVEAHYSWDHAADAYLNLLCQAAALTSPSPETE